MGLDAGNRKGTIAHEMAHVRGADEDEADRIQLRVFADLMRSVGNLTPRQAMAAARFPSS